MNGMKVRFHSLVSSASAIKFYQKTQIHAFVKITGFRRNRRAYNIIRSDTKTYRRRFMNILYTVCADLLSVTALAIAIEK